MHTIALRLGQKGALIREEDPARLVPIPGTAQATSTIGDNRRADDCFCAGLTQRLSAEDAGKSAMCCSTLPANGEDIQEAKDPVNPSGTSHGLFTLVT